MLKPKLDPLRIVFFFFTSIYFHSHFLLKTRQILILQRDNPEITIWRMRILIYNNMTRQINKTSEVWRLKASAATLKRSPIILVQIGLRRQVVSGVIGTLCNCGNQLNGNISAGKMKGNAQGGWTYCGLTERTSVLLQAFDKYKRRGKSSALIKCLLHPTGRMDVRKTAKAPCYKQLHSPFEYERAKCTLAQMQYFNSKSVCGV